MTKYRSSSDPSHVQDGLPVVRFNHECVEACHLGTNDHREFEEHIKACRFVLPGVAEACRRANERGERFVSPARPEPESDRPGQLSFLSPSVSKRHNQGVEYKRTI